MTIRTHEEFLHILNTTEEFDFDWCWGRHNEHVGLPAEDRSEWSTEDREYVEAVEEAQEAAAAAMERARAAYEAGDYAEALAAVNEAAYQERQFGDDPTYGWIADYLVPLASGKAE